MWKYSYNLKALYETPFGTAGLEHEGRMRKLAEELIASVRNSGRRLLTEAESKQLLSIYAIPTVPTRVATTADDAAAAAATIGYPVVLKLHSETITHKTDVGGVRLDITTEGEVRRAFEAIAEAVREHAGAGHFQGVTVQPMIRRDGYELIVGSSIDPQFGPVLLFGTGGQLVEVFRDRSLALPPLNTTLARRMMEQTRIYNALKGVRGRRPVDLAALERLLVRFSQLIVEQRWIREVDVNPLLASDRQMLVLDARVVLHDLDVKETDLPRMAIRPYPAHVQLVVAVAGWTGDPLPADPPRGRADGSSGSTSPLSESSVYLRYFHAMKLSQRIAHEQLDTDLLHRLRPRDHPHR